MVIALPPASFDLPELVSLAPDNSLRETRMADVLGWLARVSAERQELPAGDGLAALMGLLADEQRRNDIRHGLTEEQRAQLEAALLKRAAD
jgi:hypothetical protein